MNHLVDQSDIVLLCKFRLTTTVQNVLSVLGEHGSISNFFICRII